MKPSIRFRLTKGTIHVEIKINGDKAVPFSLGIALHPDQWHQQKQLCGDPTKAQFLKETAATLTDLYLPGMDADKLFKTYWDRLHRGSAHTLSAAINHYLSTAEVSASTKGNYSKTLRVLQELHVDARLITNLTAAEVKAIIQAMRELGRYSESSIYTMYTQILSAVNTYTRDHNLATAGKLSGAMRPPHIGKGGRIKVDQNNYLDTIDLARLMDLDLQDDKSLVDARKRAVVQAFTGMAVADLSRVDKLDDHIVRANDREWFVYRRKKNGQRCEIQMTEVLRRYLHELPWPMPYGERQYNKHLQTLGNMLTRHISSHTLRHTFGVIMIEAGFSMEAIRKMMGHSSIKITEQVYAKITEKRVADEHFRNREALERITEHF